LEFSTPIWVALMANLFLGEAPTPDHFLAVGLGFIGILIVARPDIDNINSAILAAMGCAICFAGCLIATKKLTSDQSISCILSWLKVMQLFNGGITVFLTRGITIPKMLISYG